jgi:uncharacterized membrane protein
MLTAAVILFAVSALVIAGLLYGFSTFIMRGLDQAGPVSAVRSMQGINRTVFTPWVMVPFIGTAPFGILLSVLAWTVAPDIAAMPMTFAAISYLLGVVVLTGLGNVPLNEHLDTVDAEAADAAQHWQRYLRLWTRFNHLRTALAIVAGVLAFTAL